ncbi:MAG: epoxide hydrolase family protein [Nakamurella sp.]
MTNNPKDYAMTPTPFTIDIPAADVTALRRRLRSTRFPQVSPNTDFTRGTSGEYLRELVAAWADFDWPAAQARLNQIPQFVAEVSAGGDTSVPTRIHYLHATSTDPEAIPILLVHGWPDSPFRFRTAIPLLTGPTTSGPAFEVIAPSLPGFHFSGHAALHTDAVADLFAALMTELGHEKFVLAGGDIGSGVGLSMGRRHPDRLIGLHLTNVSSVDDTQPPIPVDQGPTYHVVDSRLTAQEWPECPGYGGV